MYRDEHIPGLPDVIEAPAPAAPKTWNEMSPDERADEALRNIREADLRLATEDAQTLAEAPVELPPEPPPPGDEDADRFIGSIAHQAARPTIQVTLDERAVNTAAIRVLCTDDTLYQRAGMLVHTVRDLTPGRDPVKRPADAPRIARITAPLLSEALSSAAVWLEPRGKGKWVPIHPPGPVVFAVLARGEWPGIRGLEMISETPLLRPDGTVLQKQGYDAASQILLVPTVQIPPVPDNPTQAEAQAAADRLLDLVCDFPFEGSTREKPDSPHRSAWLAALLTPFAHETYRCPAPLFLIDANTPASGKTLLADLVAAIAGGRDFARTSPASDRDETLKQLVSIALAGDRMVLFDNVSGSFGNDTLDRYLTATSIKERLLGSNTIANLPLRPVWFATANNVTLKGDIYRRICYCRLQSPEEHPENRSGFKYGSSTQLLDHVRRNRATYVRDCLLVLRAFFAHGKPATVDPWGSFDGWAQTVPAAIKWLGYADPTKTRQQVVEQGGSLSALKALIVGLRALAWSEHGLTTRAIIEQVGPPPQEGGTDRHEILRAALDDLCPGKDGRYSTTTVGRVLGSYRDRVVKVGEESWMLRHATLSGGSTRWKMERVGEAPAEPAAREPGDDDPYSDNDDLWRK